MFLKTYKYVTLISCNLVIIPTSVCFTADLANLLEDKNRGKIEKTKERKLERRAGTENVIGLIYNIALSNYVFRCLPVGNL